jgi:hypothetical protein
MIVDLVKMNKGESLFRGRIADWLPPDSFVGGGSNTLTFLMICTLITFVNRCDAFHWDVMLSSILEWIPNTSLSDP